MGVSTGYAVSGADYFYGGQQPEAQPDPLPPAPPPGENAHQAARVMDNYYARIGYDQAALFRANLDSTNALPEGTLLRTGGASDSAGATGAATAYATAPITGTEGAQGLQDPDVPDNVWNYVPTFHMHADEQYMPGDPDAFVSVSSLRQHQSCQINSPRIETGPFGFPIIRPPSVSCDDVEVYGRGRINPASLSTQQGSDLYLDPADPGEHPDAERLRHGNAATAPVLYQYDPGVPGDPDHPPTMTYWLFSPYNDGPSAQNHEGDWERVTVVFGNGTDSEPTEVRYSSHDGNTSLAWDEVPKDASGRPVVYVAKGSHAMSPYPTSQPTGAPGIDDSFGTGGVVIDPLETHDGVSRLEDVEDQAWWGTRVHWGERGDVNAIGPLPDNIQGATSGPEGPMPGPDGKGALGETEHRPRVPDAWDLAGLALNDPASARTLTESLLARLGAAETDEGDELAQDFVEVLDMWRTESGASGLEAFATSEDGREVLRWMAEELENGPTHPDEVATYNKIREALLPHGIELPLIEADA